MSEFLMIFMCFQRECLDGLVSNFLIKNQGAEVQDYNFWNLHLFLHNSWICTFYSQICTYSMRSALFMAPKRYFRTRIPARDQRAVRPREHLLREHIEPEGTVGAFPEQMMQRRAAELHFCTFSRSALSGRFWTKSALSALFPFTINLF